MLTGVIGQDLKAADDYIFNQEALPNATTETSDPFRIGQVQSGVEIIAKAAGAITIADTKVLKIELLQCDTIDGSFGDAVELYGLTSSGGDTIADETELVRYVPNSNIKMYGKLKITTTADQSAHKITAYPHFIAR